MKVTLAGGGLNLETVTDIFGDFEFERLEKNESYTVTVAAEGYAPKQVSFVTRKDINLGEVVLDPQ